MIPVTAAIEGENGWVAVFRQFDTSRFQDGPEDLLCGWVRLEDAVKLEGWVADMNRQLKRLLIVKHEQYPGGF